MTHVNQTISRIPISALPSSLNNGPATTPKLSAFRQPFTTAAFLSLFSCYCAVAILAVFPHTYIFKLSLLPIIIWQAWYCAVALDCPTRFGTIPGTGECGPTQSLQFGLCSAVALKFYISSGPRTLTQFISWRIARVIDWCIDLGAGVAGMGIHQDIVTEVRTISKRSKCPRRTTLVYPERSP
jgi:hypothetical protein